MGARLNPYFNFPGTARDAMEFYKSVFGGELTISTFGEYGGAPEGMANPDPDGVMHANLEAPNDIVLMASDLPPGQPHEPGRNISVSLSGDDEETLRGYWDKLSSAGSIEMALERQMWGDDFGSCTDQFGINWMVNIAGPGNASS